MSISEQDLARLAELYNLETTKPHEHITWLNNETTRIEATNSGPIQRVIVDDANAETELNGITLFDPNVGMTFIITLIFFLAFACAIIYGFQPFTMNVLKISQQQNAILFTVFGIVGLISQTFLVARISKVLGMKKAFTTSILFTAIAFIIMYFSHSLPARASASIYAARISAHLPASAPRVGADSRSRG